MAAVMQTASRLSFMFMKSVPNVWSTAQPFMRRLVGAVSLLAWFIGTAILATHVFVMGNGLVESVSVELHLLPGRVSGADVVQLMLWDLPVFFAILTWGGTVMAIAAVTALTLVALLAAVAAGLPPVTGGLSSGSPWKPAPLDVTKWYWSMCRPRSPTETALVS